MSEEKKATRQELIERIEELEKEIERLNRELICCDNMYKMMKANSISKNKIIEKIKEYDKWIEKEEYTRYIESLEAQRYALKELLEEK